MFGSQAAFGIAVLLLLMFSTAGVFYGGSPTARIASGVVLLLVGGLLAFGLVMSDSSLWWRLPWGVAGVLMCLTGHRHGADLWGVWPR